MIIGHGGNKTDLARALGCSIDQIIDMSSNLNPLGPPDAIKEVICRHVDCIQSLPSPDAGGMVHKFAGFHEIDPGRVVAGNGTTWFIYTLPRALNLKKVLVAGPTYSDYSDACRMNGTQVVYSMAKSANGFLPDLAELSQKAAGCDAVFICNPNNPTGSLIPKDHLDALVKKHPQTLFVIDESYLPFVADAEQRSFVTSTDSKNVVVLSSMSKIFCIPGLRTGFLTADAGLAEKIMAWYQPWSVHSLAQKVIEDIFDHPDDILPFYQKTRAYIQSEKQFFFDQLGQIHGMTLFETSTYFVLARLSPPLCSEAFCRKIGQGRVLIRDCSNFDGLGNAYVRFSLKTRTENQMLADLVKEVVNCHV